MASGGGGGGSRRKSLFERLTKKDDPKLQQDVALGRRIGLYRIKTQLGAGTFAKVKLGIHLLTNERVAIKVIDKTKLDEETRKILSREITCMERLCHPNIVHLFEVIETHPRLYLIMECASEGSIEDKINKDGPFNESYAKKIFIQLASAINYMHKTGVIHRDLKAENVFFANENLIKVGDFGFSTLASPKTLLDTFCGSPAYAAPELFRDEHYLGTCVDIWAMGVMLYFMATGNMPFRGDSVHQLKQKILEGVYHMPNNLSNPWKELIKGMLHFKPQVRYNMEYVFNSEWIITNDTAVDKDVFIPESESKRFDNSLHSGKTLDPQVLQWMDELGIPTFNYDKLVGEPRTSIAGAYRIFLHRRLTQQEMTKEDMNEMTVDKEVVNDKNVNSSFQRKKTHKNSDNQQKSKFCVIL